MKELITSCIRWAITVSSGCSECDDLFGIKENTKELPATNWDNWGGKYSGLGSLIGGRFGFQGAVIGYAVGTAVDVINFNNLGENYKNYIISEIKDGNIPAD